jgi:NAD(P)-dependent dehydrogenase (short-subunit alcohol dehydrogenase family)
MVIIVSGGAGLLGSEIVKAIGHAGAFVVIADLDEKPGRELKDRLSTELDPGRLQFRKLDITKKSSVRELLADTQKESGKIDAIVNSAYPRNKYYGRDFLEVEYEDFCENINLHLGGYFLLAQEYIKFCLKQGHGNILNLASVYGHLTPRFELYENTGMTMPVEYAAIKSGIIHLTRYMAKYLKNRNIRINSISPGGILDNQPEIFLQKYRSFCLNKGMLDPSDITGLIVFLLSGESEFINGQDITLDDGFSL